VSKNYYKEVLEALHMRKKKRLVYNKLNEASIYSEDYQLRILASEAKEGLMASSTNTEITPLIEFNFVDTKDLQQLCERNSPP